MAALNLPLSAAAPADSDGNLNVLVPRAVRGGGLRWVMLEADDGAFIGALGFDHRSLGRTGLALHPDHSPACRARAKSTKALKAAVGLRRLG